MEGHDQLCIQTTSSKQYTQVLHSMYCPVYFTRVVFCEEVVRRLCTVIISYAEIFITTAEMWSGAIHLYPLGTQLSVHCVVDC